MAQDETAEKPLAPSTLRLILLRHAKSDWPEGVADEERPLAERGRKAAALMGDYLAREGLTPELALVSTARRTRETWALVAERLPAGPPMRHEADLYAASAEGILRVLRSVDAGCRSVLVLGHNPGMEDLALMLAGHGAAAERRRMAEKYPTGGLAVIDLPVGRWADIKAGAGVLERFVTPRSLT